jgi:hypothetical protein
VISFWGHLPNLHFLFRLSRGGKVAVKCCNFFRIRFAEFVLRILRGVGRLEIGATWEWGTSEKFDHENFLLEHVWKLRDSGVSRSRTANMFFLENSQNTEISNPLSVNLRITEDIEGTRRKNIVKDGLVLEFDLVAQNVKSHSTAIWILYRFCPRHVPKSSDCFVCIMCGSD